VQHSSASSTSKQHEDHQAAHAGTTNGITTEGARTHHRLGIIKLTDKSVGYGAAVEAQCRGILARNEHCKR
jgi:hypothetical protein